MKGTIVKCMEELVTQKFGAPKWKEALKRSGHSENAHFLTTADVPDGEVMSLMKGIADTAGLSMTQLSEAFGEYWSMVYAPQLYGIYFEKAKNTKELLLNLDHIHTAMTKSMKGAAPPHFTYEQVGDKTLIMHYNSPRGLISLMPGLIRGVAKYYKERVDVQTNGNSLRIHFA